MKKIIFIGFFVMFLFLINGCQNPFDDKDYFPKDAIDCGSIVAYGIVKITYDNVEYSDKVKDCFYNAFKDCKPAFIKETHYGDGGPVFEIAFIEEGTCRILYFKDTRQDIYGGGRGIIREYCNNISIGFGGINKSIKFLRFSPCGRSGGGQAIY